MIKFLLFLSGFKKDVIDNCKMDKFHAIAIGCIMLFVGTYATLAWYLFFNTAFNMGWEALPLGILFGYFIVCFDRALIASMIVQKETGGIIFRFILAILLGVFLAQPIILKIYQQEVTRKAELLIGDENTKKQEELDDKYKVRIADYQKEIDRCDTLISKAKQYHENKTKIFQDEYKGTGGSGLVGYNIRAQKDESIMDGAQTEYDNIYKENNPKIQQCRDSINSLEQMKKKEYDKFVADNKNAGLIMQEKALMELMREDNTLRFRYYLLSIILTLIELSALIAKLFFPFKSYKSEISFITDTEVKNSCNKKEMTTENLDCTKAELKKSFSEHIKSFFAKTKPVTERKLNEMITEWEQEKSVPLKEFCQSFMDKLLIQGVKIEEVTGNKKSELITDVLDNIAIFIIVIVALSIIFLYYISKHIDGNLLTLASIMVTLTDIGLISYKAFDDYKKKKNNKS